MTAKVSTILAISKESRNKTNKAKTFELYLGYDANCSKCSMIATRIEDEVGGELSLIPLSSPRMRQWRKDLLGEDAKWAPTLVRVSEDRENAYVGWQIGPPLAAALGGKRSLKVLSTLGSDQLAESSPNGGPLKTSLNRRAFLWGSAVVAGMTVLMGRTNPATAVSGDLNQDMTVERVRVLHGSDMYDELRAHLSAPDASNVISSDSLGERAKKAATLMEVPSDTFREVSESTGEHAPDGNVSEVQATKVTYSNGVIESAVAIYNHENKTMLVSRRMEKPIDGVFSIVRRLDVAPDKLNMITQSINGSVPREISVKDISSLASDPCGGCAGAPGDNSRKRLQSVCNWELTLSCARDAGLCLGCIPFVIGSVTAVLLCVAGQCGWSALESCCGSASNACVGCGGQT
ncbi:MULTISPECIES: hypothetical protein [unclassified Arthrobacter]|uniref:hypothetical protein n=1 Tax=unclassified Arthrobacter TaxID=235627 RepID=UPI0011B058A0|nr:MULTISPECIES: hypothetical protein [unclassified Arthrobacter]